MNLRILLPIFFFLVSSLVVSCTSDDHSDEVNNDSAVTIMEEPEISPEVELILRSDKNGAFRGMSLGMHRDTVLLKEDSITMLNESPESLVYQLTYSPNQDVDIEYAFNNYSNLIKIQADLYPQSEAEHARIFNELISYFKYRYGEPDFDSENELRWKNRLGEFELILKAQGNKKVKDIQIEFNPIIHTPSGMALLNK
ncbi:MAG: hypothetical protein ACK4ND_09860 [Cytophagaceae bacterium]